MKKFMIGFICGSALLACGTTPIFPYKFFHLSGNNYAGQLLGPDETKDIPFTECKPVNGKQKCVVVFYTELNALVQDYKKTKSDLIACQKGR